MRKAFDRVWREALWVKLHALGVQGRVFRVLRAWYSRVFAAVRVGSKCSSLFPLKWGVKQGCVLSPLLFSVFINDILDDMKNENLGALVPEVSRPNPFRDSRLAGLLWADDLVVLADDMDMLKRMLGHLTAWCSRWKMECNAKKCAILYFHKRDENDAAEEARRRADLYGDRQSAPQIQGEVVEVRKHYRYLGILFSDSLTFEKERESRCQVTRKALYAKERFLRSPAIPVTVRLHVLKTCVFPVALYGSELWVEGVRRGCEKLSSLIAHGLRWILCANNLVAKTYLEWELGVIPLRILAMRRSVRLFVKMLSRNLPGKGADDLTRTWTALLMGHCSRLHQKWSWRTRVFKYAKDLSLPQRLLELLNPNNAGNVCMRDKPLLIKGAAGAIKICSERLALSSARKFNRASLLTQLRCDEDKYQRASYLKGTTTLAVRLLFRLRTGSLPLNVKAVHFSPDVLNKSCPICSGEDETWQHFLVDCPGLEHARSGMLEALKSPLPSGELLDVRNPATWLRVPLPEASSEARTLSLPMMWRIRSAHQRRNRSTLRTEATRCSRVEQSAQC